MFAYMNESVSVCSWVIYYYVMPVYVCVCLHIYIYICTHVFGCLCACPQAYTSIYYYTPPLMKLGGILETLCLSVPLSFDVSGLCPVNTF